MSAHGLSFAVLSEDAVDDDLTQLLDDVIAESVSLEEPDLPSQLLGGSGFSGDAPFTLPSATLRGVR